MSAATSPGASAGRVGLPQDAGLGAVTHQQIDVDEAGLPTVTGYRQLYAIALERLAADEPSWPRKRRERVARDMTEAYCRGAVECAQRDRGICSGSGMEVHR